MADNQTKKYLDILTAFPSGINSGVAPILLPKDQASFAINTTFRGGYATDRAPVQKLALNFGGDEELETAFRNGFFQGASKTPYRPDFGPSQHIVQISGRLFAVTENGSVWDVTEITVPGDPNDATTSQVWMWQAEKWMIISDGSAKLPIFYDGVTSRRSYGPSVTIVPAGDITATNPVDVPSVGGSVTLTLANPYSGAFDVPVRFNGAIYQTSGTTALGNITLQNVNATAGVVVPSGTDIVVNPNLIGYTVGNATSSQALSSSVYCIIPIRCSTNYSMTFVLQLTSVGSLVVGSSVNITTNTGAHSFTVVSIVGTTVTVQRIVGSTVAPVSGTVTPPPPAAETIVDNSNVQYSSSVGPIVILGQLTADYTNPAVGATADGFMSVPYSGAADQIVTIDGFSYIINAIPPTGGVALTLINLNDTPGVVYDNPPGELANLDITSIPEIPACRMGAYGLGQNWFSFTDGLGFGPSDLVGSSSGSPAYNYRDAVLKTSDLEVMGGFRIPNAGEIITSMTFVATLDAALGQGPLQIGVSSGMFSVMAPFTLLDFQGLTNAVSGDLVTAPITNPILTKSLIGFGPIAQNSTVVANSDTIFRSFEGVNSLILARRDFSDIGGNTPISREMTRAIDLDNKSLLSYSSAIVFDNRLRMTCSPQVSGQGVFHMGELVLNYDLISSLRGKAPPVWEGLWTGTNVLQYAQGLFGTVSRAFAFTFNITDEQIELYELLPTGTEHFDNETTRIRWIVETPVLFNAQVKNLTDVARMMDGEMYLSDINGQVDVVVLYRPVFYPCWRPWHTFSVCSDMSADNAKEQTIHPLGFGEPDPRDCDPINNQSFRQGVGFQLRLEFTGHCKLWGVRVLGHQVPTDAFAKPAGC